MSRERSVFSRERRWLMPVTALTAAGALALVGCGKGSGDSDPSTKGEASSSATARGNAHEFTFDDLGAGYESIFVYPGATNSEADKKPSGRHVDGETFMADCKTTGRTVNSDTANHEPDVSSDQWVRFQDGEVSYATAVYIEHSQQVLEQLPEC